MKVGYMPLIKFKNLFFNYKSTFYDSFFVHKVPLLDHSKGGREEIIKLPQSRVLCTR